MMMSTPKTRNIAVRIFDDQQRQYLESEIRLCRSRLLADWSFVGANEADVVLVCPQDPGADALISFCLNSKNKIPVVYSEKNTTVSPWFLQRPAKKEDLIEFLNGLYLKSESVKPASRNTCSKIASFTDDNNRNTANLIQLLASQDKPVRLVNEESYTLFYNPDSQVFLADQPLRLKCIENSASWDIQTQVPQDDSLKEVMSLQELKWNFARLCSNMPAIHTGEILHLAKWPDFAYLQHDSQDIYIAAFFMRYAASIQIASEQLGVPIENISRFCAAAKLAGYFCVQEDELIANTQIRHKTSKANKLMRSIVKRLHRDID